MKGLYSHSNYTQCTLYISYMATIDQLSYPHRCYLEKYEIIILIYNGIACRLELLYILASEEKILQSIQPVIMNV